MSDDYTEDSISQSGEGHSDRRGFLKRTTAGLLGAALGGSAAAGYAGTQAGAASEGATQPAFESRWPRGVERPWLGTHYWANPLQDWRLAKSGRVEMIGAGANRNVHLLTHRLAARGGAFAMRAHLGFYDRPGTGRAGFLIGVQGPEDEYRSDAVYGEGMPVGLTSEGRLFIGDETGEPSALPREGAVLEVAAESAAQSGDESYTLVLDLRHPANGQRLGQMRRSGLDPGALAGGVALLAGFEEDGDAPGAWGVPRLWFEGWQLGGDKVEAHPERAFGPIFFAQHTLSRSTMKMTAQLSPVGAGDDEAARLQVRRGGAWTTVAEAPVHGLARTATFRVEGWDDAQDVPYRLAYRYQGHGGTQTHHYEGTVRRDPVEKDDLVVVGLSCRYTLTFPHAEVVRGVQHHDPDLLAFTGDQYYEGAGGYGVQRNREELERATLDVLRKWVLHGWAFGDLMRDRPTVTIPDDHDVYQGNLWGEGGLLVDRYELHNNGGYLMPPEWVNAVQRMQTSHLPDPFDPAPIKNGIGVYYADLVYGRVSFAILEDRKWKSGPDGLVPAHPGRPDHIEDPGYDPSELDVPAAELLGARQLRFLDEWTADWRGADMKAVISQTCFAQLPTHHGSGGWPSTTFMYLVADLDTNGWPQSGRDQAIRQMRKGRAFHLGGDQHLPMVLRYGVEAFDDAGYNFCVPAISVSYPRGFWPSRMPPEERKRFEPLDGRSTLAGHYTDGLGNKMTVHAVANPAYDFRLEPPLPSQSDKSAGYGIVRFRKPAREITMEAWPILSDPRQGDAGQFPGWPQTVRAEENDGREAKAYLPTLKISGATDPVVQVVDEEQNEVLYTARIQGQSFRPKVFRADGSYTVRVGDGEDWQEVIEGVKDGVGAEKTLDIAL